MNAENFDIDALLRMAHSPVSNYVLPGLTSSLIGAPSDKGTVRLFQNEREHQESITPHSHRFDFMCWVLRGSVRNRLWTKSYASDREADEYRTTTLRYGGEIGKYATEPGEVHRCSSRHETRGCRWGSARLTGSAWCRSAENYATRRHCETP